MSGEQVRAIPRCGEWATQLIARCVGLSIVAATVASRASQIMTAPVSESGAMTTAWAIGHVGVSHGSRHKSKQKMNGWRCNRMAGIYMVLGDS